MKQRRRRVVREKHKSSPGGAVCRAARRGSAMFNGKFITLAEFAFLVPIDVFHREEEQKELPRHPDELKNLHIRFRRSFVWDPGEYPSVSICLTADDYYKLRINGQPAGQGPAQGYYFDYPFNLLDITPLLADGENLIEADVYYQGLINRAFDSGDLRCGFIADVIGTKPDGTDEILLVTDESWQCAVDRSFIGRDTIAYDTQFAEHRDMRLGLTEWERVRVKAHDYTFAEEPTPTLSVYDAEPTASLRTKTGTLYDFGGELTGGFRIVVTGKSGDVIEVRAAEELEKNADGTCPPDGVLTEETKIRYKTRANCLYSEQIILHDGENVIEQYDYKAFRYAELVYGEGIEAVSLCAVVRHWDFDDDACLLDSSDKVLSSVFDICKRGVKFGSQEVYVDCPGREKGQYAGDLTITSASQLWLTGDTRLFRKAVRNQAESTFIDEGLMAVTPGSLMQEIADYSLQFPILALRYYDFTGDRAGLKKLLGVCDRILTRFEQYQREDGLLDGVDCKWNLVDWPKNLRDDYDFELTKPIGKGVHNVINAFYIGAVLLTEKIIDILGIPLEEGARRSEALIEAYHNCFWRPSLGLYADSETSDHTSLHSNILPAYFGFEKTEAKPRIAAMVRRKGLVCGVYMAYFTLKALCRMGYYTDAYRLITSTDEHSWYNMVCEGATTCYEAWGREMKWNTSLCHPWASGPISVLIEDILGITPDRPGFSEVDVRPHIPSDVEKLHMRIPLPNGKHIEFEWDDGFYNYRILK